MADLYLIKTTAGLLAPSTEADREYLAKVKVGAVISGEFRKTRNAGHHRKFFKLLDLTYQYWEPSGGLVSRQELRGIKGLAEYFEQLNGRPGQLSQAVQAYISKLHDERSERFPSIDKSREALLDWVVTEAGHYTLVQTPSGVERRRKSISWAAMDQVEFDALYKDVFNVCWRMVLSAHFPTEAEAMSAAEELNQFA